MNQKKAIEMLHSQEPPPADAPCMVFRPGRYYLGMFYVYLPAGGPGEPLPYGGNVTALVWRYEGEPDTWHATYRFRYYVDLSGDPNAPDKRNWYWAKTDKPTSEEEMIPLTKEALRLMAGVAGGRVLEPFLIQGDSEKFVGLMRAGKGPEWLHFGGFAV